MSCTDDNDELTAAGEFLGSAASDFLDWVVDEFGCDAHNVPPKELARAQERYTRDNRKRQR